jgi:hypothetical protein
MCKKREKKFMNDLSLSNNDMIYINFMPLRDDGKMKERGIHEEFFSRDKEREVKVEN